MAKKNETTNEIALFGAQSGNAVAITDYGDAAGAG